MTTKRFTIKEFSTLDAMSSLDVICDNGIELPSSTACDLLNELHEDNQLLHKMNANAIDFMYDNFDLNIVFTDRELNNICNEMGWELSEKGIKIDQLKKENEQLKEALFFYISVAITETSSHINEDLEQECNQLLKCSYKEALEKYDTSKYEGV